MPVSVVAKTRQLLLPIAEGWRPNSGWEFQPEEVGKTKTERRESGHIQETENKLTQLENRIQESGGQR